MGDAIMQYRYHHFYLPIARYVNRLSPAAKIAVVIGQLVLFGTLLAFELTNMPGVL